MKCILIVVCIAAFFAPTFSQSRKDISLNENWRSIASDSDRLLDHQLFLPVCNDAGWKKINVPHNWDDYFGYRRLVHGNRHGEAWYRKSFSVRQAKKGKHFFVFFEGVGSYAQVYLNGKHVGDHSGGRTTFTIDITNEIKTDGTKNLLAVLAQHPSQITDLPWVCGGCSSERGFSEGSQPMGIFRPVHLIVTSDVRVEPFGVHVWANNILEKEKQNISISTTLKNYSDSKKSLSIINQLVDKTGKVVATFSTQTNIGAYGSTTISQLNQPVKNISIWSLEDPYVYKIVTVIKENGIEIDRVQTDFGFREISWSKPSHEFLLNGKPVFINGIAEYEHLLGQSHAFGDEEIKARMKWMRGAGFNAFRDAHQPHNLLYGRICDENGILWWPQFSAHIWFDNPTFKTNFKNLLRDWIIERRNDPAVILWGLQNESKLPEDFARECTQIIRQLDPTASSQRLITTCNGGSGTDWDVPQNWTGTYGGDPDTYAQDLKKQVLIGEYGAWRTIDLHSENDSVQSTMLSEDRMTSLMEKKIRLAESVKDSSAGQFFWLLSSHDNPGRVQGGEGLREADRIGPVNYKGLLTPWEEPSDAYYLFRSNYASKLTDPMAYIVSHTWPTRWISPGIKSGIKVFSNCDEVELFNDVDHVSLGRKKRDGIGTHFQWDNVPVNYNLLQAIGYVNGKAVARDLVVLDHLPAAPHFNSLIQEKGITKPADGFQYIYRLNCGGPDYKDAYGNLWKADRPFYKHEQSHSENFVYSTSWSSKFDNMPPLFASQRRIHDPIGGTRDWKLFQDFRYGKDQLQFVFPLPDGDYLLELFFCEPWLGVGGSKDEKGMRLFDVAVNDKVVLKHLDIWKESGTATALKKSVMVHVTGGSMIISFSNSKAGQALISAIAISSKKKNIFPAPASSILSSLSCEDCQLQSWLDEGDACYADSRSSFHSLPPNLFTADWIKFKNQSLQKISFVPAINVDVFVAVDSGIQLKDFETTRAILETDFGGGKRFSVIRKRINAGVVFNLQAMSSPCFIMLLPATDMQPAYDLKPVVAYRQASERSGEVSNETVNGRSTEYITSKRDVSVTYRIETGVADIYSITVKYFYPGDKLKADIAVVDVAGKLLKQEQVDLVNTKAGKWNTVTINTGTMINAGSYKIILSTTNAEGLALSGVDIQ